MKEILIRPVAFILLQIPLQLEYIKTKEDVLIEVSMLFIAVIIGVGLLFAVNIKNKVPYTKLDLVTDWFIAFFVTALVHYTMLFYHSTYPRFLVDALVSYFAYAIITALKKAAEKKIKKIVEDATDIIDINH